MNTAVSALLHAGADAMDNIFDVQIIWEALLPLTEERENIRLRCLTFTPPKFSVKTTNFVYKNYKVTKPLAEIEGDRTFTLSFRVDANYEQYKKLYEWQASTFVPSKIYTSSKIPVDKLATVRVCSLAAPAEIQSVGSKPLYEVLPLNQLSIWEFSDVWITEVGQPSYSYNKGDPVEISASFTFGEAKDPWYHWNDGIKTI